MRSDAQLVCHGRALDRRRAALALVLGGLSLPAAATLGEGYASIDTDARGAQIVWRSQQTRGEVTVHLLALASGTQVRELVDNHGRVFAVAWQGTAVPDLRQLLGVAFRTVVAAAQTPHGGHHQLVFTRDDLVYRAQGTQRFLRGSAWLISRLPAGLTAVTLEQMLR